MYKKIILIALLVAICLQMTDAVAQTAYKKKKLKYKPGAAVSNASNSRVQAATVQGDTTDAFIFIGKHRFRDFNRNGKLDVYEDYRKPIDQRAKDLLLRMNMEEKLAQLKSPWTAKSKLYPGNHFDNSQALKLFPNGLGTILRISDGFSYTSNEGTPEPAQMAILANQTQQFFVCKTRLGIPVLFLEEALHGLVVKHGTVFPSALGMSSSWNEDLTREVFQSIAAEASAVGTRAVLAPVIDLALDPRWGRTEETMGEDPYLTSRLGVVKVKALQGNSDIPDSNHVASVLKHFGAHGQPEGGNNTGPSFISERQLREVNFKPFRAAITAGKALGIMPNYNEISGLPVHANRWMLTDVLRKEWAFKGVVISDYNATAELKETHHVAADNTEAGAMALNAGVDVELTDNFMYTGIPSAIKKGSTTLAALNEAVLHVLELKLRVGLFERPFIDTKHTAIVGSEDHNALALKAARQSIILLKNENGLLPLDRKKYRKIAIIGPNADQCILGGYSQIPKVTISPLEAIREKYKDLQIVYAPGCRLLNARRSNSMFGPVKLASHEDNVKLIREAVEVARNADVVLLMLGGNDRISREAVSNYAPGDLADLELLGDQNELVDSLKTLNKPTAAFVFSGPPISFLHLTKSVPAIVQCWYLGQQTGYAVAETIFGDNNPSGKLTISIPRSAGHLPAYYFTKPSSRIRGYNLDQSSPLYPFGFGLSYTSYEYSNLKISKPVISANESVTVTVDVKNTGLRAGEEIVQLYIRDKVSSITRPVKELKDFKRVPLAPGETKQVIFTITPDKLKFYNIQMKEVIEPGDFEIMVGPSSDNTSTVRLTVA